MRGFAKIMPAAEALSTTMSFLPMIGMMGIDWGYGFDKVFGSKQYGGSQFHFILGQEF